MNLTQLSRELRTGTSAHLQRRRWNIGLSMVGTVAAQIAAFYQVGMIKRLPDPPVALFDSDRVDASDYAHKRFDTPDGFLMLINYALIATLAAAGGEDRARIMPLLPIATLAKTLLDSSSAVRLGFEEWGDNQALCAYCQAATLASLASVAFALPEALEAFKQKSVMVGQK
jgi:uncharacterized membrane protein